MIKDNLHLLLLQEAKMKKRPKNLFLRFTANG